MATGQAGGVLTELRRVALLGQGGSLTDGELLEAFLARREDAAFEALLQRYGPMVLGVCRRVLRHRHDADDAFQATFLVFVTRATSIRKRRSVGSWLYGVAYRTAVQARKRAARRRRKEGEVKAETSAESAPDGLWDELKPVLDQELDRLPPRYREPVVLCDLLGKRNETPPGNWAFRKGRCRAGWRGPVRCCASG